MRAILADRFMKTFGRKSYLNSKRVAEEIKRFRIV